ncbi:hypothetical protein ACOSQ3_020644 [Xanthoceras sorbifolium]
MAVEAIVSTVLEQLISIIGREVEQEVRLVTGVRKEVEKLTSNFRAIQAVLADAEQRQVTETAVGVWLDKLKDASYDMDDVLDEWNTAILKLQIEGVENAQIPKKKVCFMFSSPCLCSRQVALRRDIGLKIKEINENLDSIAIEKDKYNLSTIGSSEEPQRMKTTSFIEVSEIYGMGGIGKTTLAQLAYNDTAIRSAFDKRIWVCVSDPFDEVRIARAIIEGLTGQTTHLVEFQSLLECICGTIVDKKFLLILDDVWIEDFAKWGPLYSSLNNGLHRESKILVTTRKDKVARVMKSIDVIPIGLLSVDKSWSLFKQLAFYDRSSEECKTFVDLGREIVGIEKLVCLRRLDKFVVGGDPDVMRMGTLECLKNLNELRGSLKLEGLGNVVDEAEAKNAQLVNKKNLVDLELSFDKKNPDNLDGAVPAGAGARSQAAGAGAGAGAGARSQAAVAGAGSQAAAGAVAAARARSQAAVAAARARSQAAVAAAAFAAAFDANDDAAVTSLDEGRRKDSAVLEALQPPPNLESLSIRLCRSITLSPHWMLSLTQLKSLTLKSCFKCEHLPPLGKLPLLESLCIFNMKSVKRVGNEFLGVENMDTSSSSESVIAFPKLKNLKIQHMDNWEDWEYEITGDITIMPSLSSLYICLCHKLKSLPDHLLHATSLKGLDIYSCPILAECYSVERGENCSRISKKI